MTVLEFTGSLALCCQFCACAFCACCGVSCRQPVNDAQAHCSTCEYNTTASPIKQLEGVKIDKFVTHTAYEEFVKVQSERRIR